MSTVNHISDEMTKALRIALKQATKHERDPETMRKAIEDMNRSREETRSRIGTVNVAVDLIRDARNQ